MEFWELTTFSPLMPLSSTVSHTASIYTTKNIFKIKNLNHIPKNIPSGLLLLIILDTTSYSDGEIKIDNENVISDYDKVFLSWAARQNLKGT